MSEMRLIDANALKTRINNVPMHGDADVFYDIMGELVSVVASAPTEDAEIVRHARWAPIKDDYGHHYQGQCTNCGCQPLRNFAHSPWLFCPNCGARMDAQEDA